MRQLSKQAIQCSGFLAHANKLLTRGGKQRAILPGRVMKRVALPDRYLYLPDCRLINRVADGGGGIQSCRQCQPGVLRHRQYVKYLAQAVAADQMRQER